MNVSIPLLLPALALIGYGILGFTPYFRAWFFSAQVYFLFASILILKIQKISWVRMGLCWPPKKRYLGYAFLFSVLPIVLFMFAELFLGMRATPQTTVLRPFHIESTRAITLFLLAPISEELLFRGVLLSAFLGVYDRKLAILFSSVLFMFAHGIWAFGPLCLGVIASYLTIRSQSLLPAMIFHAVSNLYIPLLFSFFPQTYDLIAKLPILIQ